MLPGLQAQPGLRFAWAGRSHASEEGPSLVSSVWEFESAQARPPAELAQLFAFEQAAQIGAATLEVLPVEVALTFESADEPRILRVFRGQARPTEVESHVAAARQGAFPDVRAEHGAIALFLAVEPPDRLVTVSLWSAWENIEAATAGSLPPPGAAHHARRLSATEAAHFEIVPS